VGKELGKGQGAGGGSPEQLFRENFAREVGVNDRKDAGSWADVECCRQVVQNDMEALGNPSDGGFGEASDLEKAAGNGGSAESVEGGRRFGLVGSDCGAGVKIGSGADGDFNVVEGALGFDHAAPVKRGAGFGEGGDSARQLAAVGARLQGGNGVPVQDGADDEIQDYRGKRQGSADSAARAFAAGANLFCDEAAEKRQKNSSKENGKEPEVERGEPVQGEAASEERPEELDAGGLAGIESEMKKGRSERGREDRGARNLRFG